MIEWLANDSINTQYQGMVDLMEMDLYFFSCNNLPDDASFHKASVAWLISQFKKSSTVPGNFPTAHPST